LAVVLLEAGASWVATVGVAAALAYTLARLVGIRRS